MRVPCSECHTPLKPHCPDTNTNCDWKVCPVKTCGAYIYDMGRGILRWRDGHTTTWAEQDNTTPPSTIREIQDNDDGRPAAPDA